MELRNRAMNEQAREILTNEIKLLEAQAELGSNEDKMRLRGIITAKEIKLKGSTSNQIQINPARLSPEDRKVEALRMKEAWRNCRSIDDEG
ncbi:hypothetical protein UFOVP423_45 [uncultured Caudovirales phage]|uniref:Uncharacterized protein n=1 Tax=uncultured Caudovirales phage TaxID=2100421 RepID=A0A6J5M7H2_9CAUD|nr:hypothetical protein UFOVP423_45 [uncultured Caudovirales phage]